MTISDSDLIQIPIQFDSVSIIMDVAGIVHATFSPGKKKLLTNAVK